MREETKLKEASLWQPLDDSAVRCELCNFYCRLSNNQLGRCQVRKNIDGKLYSLNYDRLCALAVDPIEKKPLYHFLPATKSFSIAAIGCNFKCGFCQNWQISQPDVSGLFDCGDSYSPQQIVDMALRAGCASVSYTYTEPTIFFEFAQETAIIAKENGLKNIFVSNGYFSEKAIEKMQGFLDAINIDLKSFSDSFYKDVCHASLEPVLRNIETISNSTDIWLELTTLIVPDQNDNPRELRDIAEFIAKKTSPSTPWHLSAFHGAFKMDSERATPIATLTSAAQIASSAGLDYVYLGNVRSESGRDTICPNCGETLIKRRSFEVVANHLENGKCPSCAEKIAGVWDR